MDSWPQNLDYNVPGGKLNRGMAVYDVLAAIKGKQVRMQQGHSMQATWWHGAVCLVWVALMDLGQYRLLYWALWLIRNCMQLVQPARAGPLSGRRVQSQRPGLVH